MTFLARYWKAIAVVLLLAGVYYLGWTHATDKAQDDQRRTENAELKRLNADLLAAQEKARIAAERLASIGAQYEKEKADAEAEHKRVVAGLRNGDIKLREHWQCPSVPATPGASPAEPDRSAELRSEGAADLVRIAAECDAQIKGLQQVTEADRAR